MMIDPVAWRQDKAQKGRALADEIKALADRARAAGFITTEYILNLAANELTNDVESENKINR
jgi:hypothetical protein